MNVGQDPSGTSRPRGRVLSATGMTVAYDRVDVVHDAAITLRPAEVTALVGPNGSGRSSLLRTIARLQPARTGDLVLDAGTGAAVDGFGLTSRRFAQCVALLTQGRPTPSGLSVRDVVEFGRHPHRGSWGRPDPGGPAAVDRALRPTGLEQLAGRRVDRLSGGQVQRVWPAGALVQAVTRNALAEPGVLGVSGGAGLGAVLLVTTVPTAGSWSVAGAAFAGASATGGGAGSGRADTAAGHAAPAPRPPVTRCAKPQVTAPGRCGVSPEWRVAAGRATMVSGRSRDVGREIPAPARQGLAQRVTVSAPPDRGTTPCQGK